MNKLARHVGAVAGVLVFGATVCAWGAEPAKDAPAKAADKACPAMAGATAACPMACDAAKHGKFSRDDFAKRHQAAFKKMDKNGDGKLSKEEFLAGRVDIYTAIDANGDEAVVVDELAAYYIHPGCKPSDCKGMPKSKDAGKVSFASMDADDDGVLVIEERVSYCTARAAAMDKDGDKKVSKAEFTADDESRFAAKDANKDGMVTEEEYILWIAGPAKTAKPAEVTK